MIDLFILFKNALSSIEIVKIKKEKNPEVLHGNFFR